MNSRYKRIFGNSEATDFIIQVRYKAQGYKSLTTPNSNKPTTNPNNFNKPAGVNIYIYIYIPVPKFQISNKKVTRI